MNRLEQQLDELGGDIAPALEEIRVPAALADGDGVIRWQNAAATDRYGDHTGQPIGSVFSDAGAGGEALLSDVLCGGRPAEFAASVRLADGRSELREISAVPVRGGASIVGLFGVSTPPAAGAETSSAEPAPPATLTERQQEVLALLAEGRSTDEIAAELGISATTVRNHIANLIAALGVHTRLQAVILAARAGLLAPPRE